jgi:hypothetical protein
MFESIPAGIMTPSGRDGAVVDARVPPPPFVGGLDVNPFPVGTPIDDDEGRGAEERSDEESCTPSVVS